jgi:2-oxoglutarate ferredoxin oxidoreductase subunit beta
LTVIAESGDGDMYGEGGNHFLHTIRRNPDITNIVHNNMVYGLTKGQASPTSQLGFRTPVQVKGVLLEPFNPLSLAISLGASFVARAFAGDVEQTKDILKMAISHSGYALVDILQPCVSFNKLNTFQWFKDKTYYLTESHDPENKEKAFQIASERDRLPLGVFYTYSGKRTFEENIGIYDQDTTPLSLRTTRRKENLKRLIQSL